VNDKELREALEALRRLVEESVEAGTPISGPLLLLKLNGILAAHPTEPAEDRWTAVMEKRARALAKAYWRGRGEEITKEQEDEFWWSFARDAQMLSKDEPAEGTGLREAATEVIAAFVENTSLTEPMERLEDALGGRESGWLVEIPPWDGVHYWWRGGFEWTPDARVAVRFARRQDAQAVADKSHPGAFVTEHTFDAALRAQPPKETKG